MSKNKFIFGILFFLTSLTTANAADTTPKYIPVLSKSKVAGQLCSSEMEKKVKEATEHFSSKGQTVERMAIVDYALPADAEECDKLNCTGVLLISGFSRRKEEFPFSPRVNDRSLTKLLCIEESVTDSKVAKTLGEFHNSCFYIFPLKEASLPGKIIMDWAKNRKDQILGILPYDNPGLKFSCKVSSEPVKEKYKEFLKREYCVSLD